MTQDSDKQPNVVDLASARRRQRTVRAGGEANAKRLGKSQKLAPKGAGRIWIYIQFLAFLAVVAYMMQLCRGPH